MKDVSILVVFACRCWLFWYFWRRSWPVLFSKAVVLGRPHGPGPRESDPPGRLWPHGPAGKFRHHGPGNRTLLGGSGHTAQGNPTLLGSSGHTAPKTGSSWEVRPHHPRSGTLQRTIVASLIMGICYFNLFLVFLEEK